MAGTLKRRHEDSNFSVPQAEANYSLRKEIHQPARHVAALSTQNISCDNDRVHSPSSVLDSHNVYVPPTRESKRILSFASAKRDEYDHDGSDPDAEKRVTIWNWREQRKLSGNSAPFKKNLKDYIRKHPDWEEYVGQDKDAVTGKKLSAKKMKAPAPHDPDHPWYTMRDVGVTSTSPLASPRSSATAHASSYGTRSTQSRLQDSDCRTLSPMRSLRPGPSPHSTAIDPELCIPMIIQLDPPAVVAQRRAVEMAARLNTMSSNGSDTPRDDELEVREVSTNQLATDPAGEKAAWAAASATVARIQAEKAAAERKAYEARLAESRSAHSVEQGTVVSAAMARIQAFKKRRMLVA